MGSRPHRASFSRVGWLACEAWARGLHRHPSPLRVESWEPVTHHLVAGGWGMWGSDLPAHGGMCWGPAQGTARCDMEEAAEGQRAAAAGLPDTPAWGGEEAAEHEWERAPTHQKTCTSQFALAGLEPPGTQWLRTTARHLAPDSVGGAPLGGSSGLDGAPSTDVAWVAWLLGDGRLSAGAVGAWPPVWLYLAAGAGCVPG